MLRPAQELVEEAVKRDGEGLPAALAAVAVWVRFSAARHLTWNRNYNVKPREISAAQVCDSQRTLSQTCGSSLIRQDDAKCLPAHRTHLLSLATCANE